MYIKAKRALSHNKKIASLLSFVAGIVNVTIGGIVGGIFYSYLGLHTLMVPAGILIMVLVYDILKNSAKG